MIVLAGLLGGAAFGAWQAKRRGGNRLDMAQYGAVHGIIGAIVGLFVTIGIERML
jgi:uncharacterized protein YqgC (DUF456 family)